MFLTDVTLREAGQLPGRSYSIEQKLDAARALDDLGVPYVQATFPATGPQDRAVTRRLASTLDAAVVTLARAKRADVTACLDAGADVVDVFGTLSESHLHHTVGLDAEEMLSRLVEQTDRVREQGAVPHVTLLDGFGTDPERLRRGYERLEDIPVVTLADTTGSRTPGQVSDVLTEGLANVDPDRVGVHFHDDLGLATANLLVAYDHGVQRGDVSVGGIGERAGNTALEEAVAIGVLERDETFGIDHHELVPRCREVLSTLGEEIDGWRPVVGESVYDHEAGIHTQAMLNGTGTFEPFDPGQFGGQRNLLFGRGTGRSGAQSLLERIDGPTDEETVSRFRSELHTSGPLELDDALALAHAVVEDAAPDGGTD